MADDVTTFATTNRVGNFVDTAMQGKAKQAIAQFLKEKR
jgi:hypothetical protein